MHGPTQVRRIASKTCAIIGGRACECAQRVDATIAILSETVVGWKAGLCAVDGGESIVGHTGAVVLCRAGEKTGGIQTTTSVVVMTVVDGCAVLTVA